MNRRQFLTLPAAAALATRSRAEDSPRARIGLVQSTHAKLARRASPEDDLDAEIVKAMVWQAIDYGKPRAGSLEAKIQPGSWVVVKPNGVYLRPAESYRPGNITDLRVIRAVVEYVATHSRAARITVAEGGSCRAPHDKAGNRTVFQDGVPKGMLDFDWGPDEFPGFNGSLAGMLAECRAKYPGRRFDFIDLNYDCVRDPGGHLKRLPVPTSPNGLSGFGARTDYFVTNTIVNCDFLISVPVIKIHDLCGITAVLKNYVGTAPREAYSTKTNWSNTYLHSQHKIDSRLDPFIVDLASFHPPDYCVADGIRGLQYYEHNRHFADQTVRNNLVMAGEDPVAMDTTISSLVGMNPWDIDFLHLAARRGMGTMDTGKIDVVGDDPGKLARYWAKPLAWYGRCNREWLTSPDPGSPLASWKRQTTIAADTLRLHGPAGKPLGTAVYVDSRTSAKAYLWVGVEGQVQAKLNGVPVMREQNHTRYRIGQFQAPVELRAGENLLEFEITPNTDQASLSAQLVGPRNDGDTVPGIRWRA